MSTTYFSKEHEYIIVEGDTGTVGITEYAQKQLGDVVFVELPAVGDQFEQDDEVCVVESVKVASEIYTPVTGEIVDVNEDLNNDAALINQDSMGIGWIFKVKIADDGEIVDLMDEDDYKEYVDEMS